MLYIYFSQHVGVTSALPDEVPEYLPYHAMASSKEWLFCGTSLHHDQRKTDWLYRRKGVTDFPHLPNLRGLSAGDSVGLLVTTSGDLYIFFDGRSGRFNGRSGHKVASCLPVNQSLWGVADVYADCSKIKSEILVGKLDGVSVWVYVCLHTCLVQSTCAHVNIHIHVHVGTQYNVHLSRDSVVIFQGFDYHSDMFSVN